ncbi:glycosyltransferase family 39 protein [Flavobacterium sp.]|uniref:glycosyltransferase family 39 protein n=1 Tax=Flavobacterium sp. TaxID=239 RepID=UPI00260689CE|nr:glycosyltransferase family 39 protein [Flavobacterium sp.]
MKILIWLKQNYFLAIILLVSAILRFYHLDFQSVWLDEIHTLNEANPTFSLTQIYNGLLISEPHPPLYFFLVHYFFILFGYTSVVLRVFSVIVGLLGIYSIYILGREIFNKKAGLYAAVLLSVNYFHIYYSQEGRMYALLFLTTTLSFYFLVKFIKEANIKSALLYGLFSTLMIYCHFFALFAFVSQYVILLYFVFKPYQSTRIQFFKYTAISGFMTLLLYIPTYSLFKRTSEMTSMWIPKPTLDVYTVVFKDFFGQSEIVLFFVTLLILLFFIQLFKVTEKQDFKTDPKEDQLVFSFLVLIIWISVTLILPLIRSYMSLPMLINRYFINILPAILILIAIGLSYIRSKLVLYSVLASIVIFSITDVVIVKHYYTLRTKSQFREVSQYIIDKNKNNEPVVSSLGWYFQYFLNNDKIKMTIVNESLADHVNMMIQDPSKRKQFWYVDAHSRPYDPEPPIQKYLDENFVVQDGTDLNDAWTKHYVTIENAITYIDLSKYNPLQDENGDNIKYNIENFEVGSNAVTASGWAYISDEDSQGAELSLVLIGPKNIKVFCQSVKRDDVTTYFKSPVDLSNSGFSSRILLDKLPQGKYQLGIQIKNSTTHKEGLVLSDKFFTK